MAKWYLKRQGEEQNNGPYSDRELKALADRGGLTPEDLIRKEGMDAWVSASKVKGLFVVDTGTGPVVLIPQKKKTETKSPASGSPPASPPSTSGPPASPAATAPAPSSKTKPTTAPGKKPTTTPKTQTSARPAPSAQTSSPQGNVVPAADPFGLGSQTPAADPFGLGTQTPAADPFGLGQAPVQVPLPPGAVPDPFGVTLPPDPFHANPNDLAALSQAAASSGVIVAAPFAEPDDEPMRRRPGGANEETLLKRVLLLSLPFILAFVVFFPLGAVLWILLALPFGGRIRIFIALGYTLVGKLFGMFGGYMIKKTSIRHDNFSYMYGGALGIFAIYTLWASSFFVLGVIVSRSVRAQVGDNVDQIDLFFVEDEEAMAQSGTEEESFSSEETPLDDFQNNLEEVRKQGGIDLIHGVNIFKAFWPFSLFVFIIYMTQRLGIRAIIVLIVEVSTMAGSTAVACWTSVHRN